MILGNFITNLIKRSLISTLSLTTDRVTYITSFSFRVNRVAIKSFSCKKFSTKMGVASQWCSMLAMIVVVMALPVNGQTGKCT